MTLGERVTVTDKFGMHAGVVVFVRDNGLCSVKWDSGVMEWIHETELSPFRAPADDGYEQDDPKHPDYHDQHAALWDSRPGK